MKNLKNYSACAAALTKLEAQLATEAKADPRFKRGHERAKRLIALLTAALGKYELVHGRKVPTKVKAAKKPAKKAKAAKPAKAADAPKPAAVAAARKKAATKRSK